MILAYRNGLGQKGDWGLSAFYNQERPHWAIGHRVRCSMYPDWNFRGTNG